jgi:hypothetical protein
MAQIHGGLLHQLLRKGANSLPAGKSQDLDQGFLGDGKLFG